jgi:hypothetical protein
MDGEKQRKVGEFVNREILCCQSSLVDAMLSKSVFDYGDIENGFYFDKEEANYNWENVLTQEDKKLYSNFGDYFEANKFDYEKSHEIYEWWLTTDWLLEKLEAKDEPILRNEYGDWWGRCCSGQAILLDNVIEEIYDETR